MINGDAIMVLDRPTKTKNNYLLDVVLRYQFAQVVQTFVHPISSSLLDDAVGERVLAGEDGRDG